ncbi:MAG: type III secretion system protein PrgN, partial [Enterococcus sp.]
MGRKTYVYSHPVNVLIIQRLGMTVDQFAEMYGFNQGTIA